MTRPEFDVEFTRLETQWPNSYGIERRALLWGAFSVVPHLQFHDAVSDCLASSRSAPLLDDLSKATLAVKTRREQDRIYKGMSTAGFGGAMYQAANNNHTADRDFVKMCVGHLDKLHRKEITMPQFIDGCAALDTLAKQLTPRVKTGTSLVGVQDRQFKDNND